MCNIPLLLNATSTQGNVENSNRKAMESKLSDQIYLDVDKFTSKRIILFLSCPSPAENVKNK